VIAIPVSLVGSFAILYPLGNMLNNLSYLAWFSGRIVVATRSLLSKTSSATCGSACRRRDAGSQEWNEIVEQLISIALTLCAVFVPSASFGTLRTVSFRQFAVTNPAASTVPYVLRSRSHSARLLRGRLFKDTIHKSVRAAPRWSTCSQGFGWFNSGFERFVERVWNLTAGGAKEWPLWLRDLRFALVELPGWSSGEGADRFSFGAGPGTSSPSFSFSRSDARATRGAMKQRPIS